MNKLLGSGDVGLGRPLLGGRGAGEVGSTGALGGLNVFAAPGLIARAASAIASGAQSFFYNGRSDFDTDTGISGGSAN